MAAATKERGSVVPQVAPATERPFSKSVLGQSLCSAGAGIFQVYSGGIAIDTISTRMQAGAGLRSAFFGSPTAQMSLTNLLHPRNLYSGHFVMACGRFGMHSL